MGRRRLLCRAVGAGAGAPPAGFRVCVVGVAEYPGRVTTPEAATTSPDSQGVVRSLAHDQGPLVRRKTAGPGLYFETWLPEASNARAVVALLHGFAEYGGRYAHVARSWAERGIGVVAVDMRGHGRAQGARGSCRRFGDYLDDLEELAALVRERGRSLPTFVFGHSFGGLVAAADGLASPSRWRGAILSNPLFGVAVEVSAVKRLVGRVASRLWPDFGLPAGVKGAQLTHDPAIARAYDEDPLVFKRARARWFTEVLAEQERVMARAGAFTLPLYVAVGTQDHVADTAATRAFFHAAGVADKTWDAREGLFHEILNEPEWPDLAAKMADWIIDRCG